MQKEDFVFSCIGDKLKSVDLVVANLEGPITDNVSVSMGSIVDTPENYTFTFAPDTAALLHRHNIKLVNLGNNHILNFGQLGEDATKEYLRAAGVEYFGDTKNNTVAHINVQGVRLAFINYNEFAPGGWRGVLRLRWRRLQRQGHRAFCLWCIRTGGRVQNHSARAPADSCASICRRWGRDGYWLAPARG